MFKKKKDAEAKESENNSVNPKKSDVKFKTSEVKYLTSDVEVGFSKKSDVKYFWWHRKLFYVIRARV